MSRTLTFRLMEDIAEWLKQAARRTGIPAGRIVREQLEKAKADSRNEDKSFMRLAGSVDGPIDLSRRKGFSRR